MARSEGWNENQLTPACHEIPPQVPVFSFPPELSLWCLLMPAMDPVFLRGNLSGGLKGAAGTLSSETLSSEICFGWKCTLMGTVYIYVFKLPSTVHHLNDKTKEREQWGTADLMWRGNLCQKRGDSTAETATTERSSQRREALSFY